MATIDLDYYCCCCTVVAKTGHRVQCFPCNRDQRSPRGRGERTNAYSQTVDDPYAASLKNLLAGFSHPKFVCHVNPADRLAPGSVHGVQKCDCLCCYFFSRRQERFPRKQQTAEHHPFCAIHILRKICRFQKLSPDLR